MSRLSRYVVANLTRAREAALLATETYNRPTSSFRTPGYVVLMTVAWTALFHAIFFKRGVQPFYRKDRKYVMVDGDRKAWDLSECVSRFWADKNQPERKNVEFFLKLRNKIEHRELPALDPEIFGECQAMLLNFESLLCAQFGQRQALGAGLCFALQLSRTRPPAQSQAMRAIAMRDMAPVRSFIEHYRSTLSQEVFGSLEYSFRVFLIPKLNSHQKSSDIAVEFVRYDPSKPEEMAKLEKIVALVKPAEAAVANVGALSPKQVAALVKQRLGRPFTVDNHTRCWRHFGVRPAAGSPSPEKCVPQFCRYDALHKDYAYTQAWVDHLVRELHDEEAWVLVMKFKPTGADGASRRGPDSLSTSARSGPPRPTTPESRL